MKALVTGGTGFIGSHLVDTLLDKGYEVRCIARAESNLRWLENKPVTIISASLYDESSLERAVEGIDALYHVAGLTAARSADEFMRGNRDATANLLSAVMHKAPNISRFVHVSSLAAVGPAASLNSPVSENTPLHPITAYGISKQAAEEVVLSAAPKIPITIVRPPAVYGERDTAILTFFQTIAKGIAPLIGFSTKHVSLIHVEDLVRGFVQAGESSRSLGQSYFISSDRFYTWEYISELTRTVMGKKFVIPIKIPTPIVMGIAGISEFFGRFMSKPPVLNYEKGKDITQDFWICSIEKAQRDFGYAPAVGLEAGIRRTVDWYTANRWL